MAFYFFKKGSGCRKNVVTASGSFSFDWNPTTVFKCLTSPLFLVLVEAQEAQEMVEFSQSFRCWQLYKKAATHSVRVMPKRKWRSFSMGEKEKNLSPATPSAVLTAGPSGRQVPSRKNFEWKQQQRKRGLRVRLLLLLYSGEIRRRREEQISRQSGFIWSFNRIDSLSTANNKVRKKSKQRGKGKSAITVYTQQRDR